MIYDSTKFFPWKLNSFTFLEQLMEDAPDNRILFPGRSEHQVRHKFEKLILMRFPGTCQIVLIVQLFLLKRNE